MATTANTTSSNTTTPTPTSLLVGLNCRGSIHLIVGTNPLASSRCAQSLAAGALPILIAPAEVELHYALQRRIDDGEVKWERKSFEDEDLFRLGREEVGNVVDAVFVTTSPRHPQSTSLLTNLPPSPAPC
jgi:uroporphyrin-III C-methyltransferase